MRKDILIKSLRDDQKLALRGCKYTSVLVTRVIEVFSAARNKKKGNTKGNGTGGRERDELLRTVLTLGGNSTHTTPRFSIV